MKFRIPETVLCVSVALFAACLTQDGYYIEGPNPRAWSPAWGLFLFGWIGVFFGVFAWLANPLLLASWYLLHKHRYRSSLYIASIALLLAGTFLLHSHVVSSEAPTYSKITGYGVGYWLWISSALVLFGGTCVLTFRPNATP